MDHPIRRIRVVVDAVLAEMDDTFDAMYATSGRSSVAPESLLKATILMAMNSIRSERAFCERLNYDLLFNWSLDLRIDQPAFDASTFSKNRQRLLDAAVADEFFAAVVQAAIDGHFAQVQLDHPIEGGHRFGVQLVEHSSVDPLIATGAQAGVGYLEVQDGSVVLP